MRSVVHVALLVVAGCGFRAGSQLLDASDPAADAPPDIAVPRDCPGDPALLLCFSFDRIATTLPNEGTAQSAAQLTDVTAAQRGPGGAAALGATSEIFVPMAPDVTGVLAFEMWFRIDTDAADLGRSGLVDSNVSPPNISLFVNRVDPVHQLRCGLGADVWIWDVPVLALATWHHAICSCDAGTLTMYLDGTKVGEHPGGACSSGGAFTTAGFTIGANNTGDPATVDDRLLGAIDMVRLWTKPIAPL